MRISWGKLCAATRHETILPLLKKKWTGCASRICTGPEMWVCSLPCGHVVSSVACGQREGKDKRCERKFNVRTCQDLSLRSLRYILHLPSEAFEACHLSATTGLLSSTNTHTYACKHRRNLHGDFYSQHVSYITITVQAQHLPGT